MEILYIAIGLISGLVIGAFAGFIWRKKVAEAKIGSAEKQATELLEDAIKKAETRKKETLIEAKEEIIAARNEAENELKAIQTHPRYKTKKCHRPNYKNIGTAMIDFLKEKYSDKPLVLYSDSSALGFYEKLGFKDDIAGTNWKVWNA